MLAYLDDFKKYKDKINEKIIAIITVMILYSQNICFAQSIDFTGAYNFSNPSNFNNLASPMCPYGIYSDNNNENYISEKERKFKKCIESKGGKACNKLKNKRIEKYINEKY